MPATEVAVPAPAPVYEPREFILALNPEAFAQQVAYLDELRAREKDPLLDGLFNFLWALGEQAYVAYGVCALPTNEVELLKQLAHRWNFQPAQLADAVRASAESMIANQVEHGDLDGQVAYLFSQWGPETTRQTLWAKAAELRSAADRESQSQANHPPTAVPASP